VRNPAGKPQRVFKTAWFSKASAKAQIPDEELSAAIRQVMLGQCDDLGGGVYKKRLSKNMARSIILARGGRYWVYEYLFAKKDQANIDNDDLVQFRKLAKNYERLTEEQVGELLQNRKWTEICNDHEG